MEVKIMAREVSHFWVNLRH